METPAYLDSCYYKLNCSFRRMHLSNKQSFKFCSFTVKIWELEQSKSIKQYSRIAALSRKARQHLKPKYFQGSRITKEHPEASSTENAWHDFKSKGKGWKNTLHLFHRVKTTALIRLQEGQHLIPSCGCL